MDGLPYSVKPTRVVWMIQASPPATPACFENTGQWQEYLMYLVASGERITRKEDTGKHAGRRVVRVVFDLIDYCQDCDIGGRHQVTMAAAGRCILGAAPPKPEQHQHQDSGPIPIERTT